MRKRNRTAENRISNKLNVRQCKKYTRTQHYEDADNFSVPACIGTASRESPCTLRSGKVVRKIHPEVEKKADARKRVVRRIIASPEKQASSIDTALSESVRIENDKNLTRRLVYIPLTLPIDVTSVESIEVFLHLTNGKCLKCAVDSLDNLPASLDDISKDRIGVQTEERKAYLAQKEPVTNVRGNDELKLSLTRRSVSRNSRKSKTPKKRYSRLPRCEFTATNSIERPYKLLNSYQHSLQAILEETEMGFENDGNGAISAVLTDLLPNSLEASTRVADKLYLNAFPFGNFSNYQNIQSNACVYKESGQNVQCLFLQNNEILKIMCSEAFANQRLIESVKLACLPGIYLANGIGWLPNTQKLMHLLETQHSDVDNLYFDLLQRSPNTLCLITKSYSFEVLKRMTEKLARHPTSHHPSYKLLMRFLTKMTPVDNKLISGYSEIFCEEMDNRSSLQPDERLDFTEQNSNLRNGLLYPLANTLPINYLPFGNGIPPINYDTNSIDYNMEGSNERANIVLSLDPPRDAYGEIEWDNYSNYSYFQNSHSSLNNFPSASPENCISVNSLHYVYPRTFEQPSLEFREENSVSQTYIAKNQEGDKDQGVVSCKSETVISTNNFVKSDDWSWKNIPTNDRKFQQITFVEETVKELSAGEDSDSCESPTSYYGTPGISRSMDDKTAELSDDSGDSFITVLDELTSPDTSFCSSAGSSTKTKVIHEKQILASRSSEKKHVTEVRDAIDTGIELINYAIAMNGVDCCSKEVPPELKTFHPTLEEMRDFHGYISFIESTGAHLAGVVKVVPPSNWNPRKQGYSLPNINITIPSPLIQNVKGKYGIYLQEYELHSKLTLQQFEELTMTRPHLPPESDDIEHLEYLYWKNILYGKAIYGADVSDSLFDDSNEIWNLKKLGSILDHVISDYGMKYEGITSPYLYFGMWKSSFPWHTEDMDLYSINYLHFGSPKFWYIIPPKYGKKFEQLAANCFPESSKVCEAFLRHKFVLTSPKLLTKYGIPFNKVIQREREFIITFPFCYHSGFNLGFNCAEAVNFATDRWIEYGKRASQCTCINTKLVKFSMDTFIQRYQPENYENWKNGSDYGSHPEEPGKQYAAPKPSRREVFNNKNNSSYELGADGPFNANTKEKRGIKRKTIFSPNVQSRRKSSSKRKSCTKRSLFPECPSS